jgi:hypothetical protein
MQKIYNVYDMKIKVWGKPNFAFRNTAEALRSFEIAINEAGTQFNRHPEDYAMYEIGTFDDETGIITMLDPKISLGTASDYVKPLASPLQAVQNN